MTYRRSRSEAVFDLINWIVMLFVLIVTLYPLLHVAAISLNDARDSLAGGIGIWPRKLSLGSYEAVFQTGGILNALSTSILRTGIGTALAIIVTSMAAYALLDQKIPGYKLFYLVFVISMFLGVGLIPTFLLYKNMGLYNNFLVYILPKVFSVFNMILLRTYMNQIPGELRESALLDGAGEFTIFARILMPLCLPIVATLALFVAVDQWNSWQDTLYFTSKVELESLQYLLMKVLRQTEAAAMARSASRSIRSKYVITPESLKMAITMVATVPILLVYPFVQRYFVKGIMIGAVKG